MADTSPSVSVILLYIAGQMDYTVACIRSLFVAAQRYPSCSILVVNNGTHEYIPTEILDEARAMAVTLDVLNFELNFGFAEGNNRASEIAFYSGADYVLLLNNDTTVAPDTISILMQTAMANPHAGAITPKILYMDDGLIWAAGSYRTELPPRISAIGRGKRDGQPYNTPRDLDYATGCALLIPRRVVEAVGLFDPAYFACWEDYDFCVRLRSHGYRILYEPSATIRHKGSASLRPFSKLKMYLIGRNMIRFYSKHGRIPLIGTYFTALVFLLAELARGRVRTVPPMAQGIWDGLRGRFGRPVWMK